MMLFDNEIQRKAGDVLCRSVKKNAFCEQMQEAGILSLLVHDRG